MGAHAIDQHPLPERIAAYHERRLPPDEAEEIRAHLAACPDCTTELLALADLYDEVDDPAAEVSPASLDAAWRRQRQRLFPASAVVVPLESRRAGPSVKRAWTAAASFALAASLLGVVALVQWRTIVRLEAPQANPPLVNLVPVDSTREGPEGAPVLTIPEEAERVWVILNPSADVSEDSAYVVEIAAPDGAVLWRQDLTVSEAGNFRLDLRRSILTTGDHQVSLFEKRGGGRRLVERYVLSVAPAP